MAEETGNAVNHPDLLAAALKMAASDVGMMRQCELTTDDGYERCPGTPTAVRFEHGFIDVVCDSHARSATSRGVLTLRGDAS